MNQKIVRSFCLLLCIMSMMFSLLGCKGETPDASDGILDPNNPTTITIWHYYNGAQQEAFNTLVSEFNDSVGPRKGHHR